MQLPEREVIIEKQNAILKKLQETLSTEELYWLNFVIDTGDAGGLWLDSTANEFLPKNDGVIEE